MTAATSVSGAGAGRMKLRAYVAYKVVLVGVIYPAVTGPIWAGGALAALGFINFAGGMIVRGMGGIAGLTAAWVVGPRLVRFNSIYGFNEDGTANVIPGHSITFAVLGTLILCSAGTGSTSLVVHSDFPGYRKLYCKPLILVHRLVQQASEQVQVR